MVKVLVATKEAQGLRTNDFAAAVEGELVYVPIAGCLPLADAPVSPIEGSGLEQTCIDNVPSIIAGCGAGDCGCDRAFPGLASARSTTTAMVMDRGDLRADDLWNALSDSLERQGRLDPEASAEEFRTFRLLFRRTLATAAHFPAGCIVERQGNRLRRRAQTEPFAIPLDLIGGDG